MIQTVCGPWLWRSVNCERTCKLQWIRSQSPSAPLSLRFMKQQEELLDNNEIPSASRKEAQQEISAKSQNRSEEHTSELQSHHDLVCRLLLEKKKAINRNRQRALHG